jgi:hypothetical protein
MMILIFQPWCYLNCPVYPEGQEREVTVYKRSDSIRESATTNFVKPEKEKLVV